MFDTACFTAVEDDSNPINHEEMTLMILIETTVCVG